MRRPEIISEIQKYYNFQDGQEASEAAVRRCFSKWAFLKIAQYSWKNNCVGVSF